MVKYSATSEKKEKSKEEIGNCTRIGRGPKDIQVSRVDEGGSKRLHEQIAGTLRGKMRVSRSQKHNEMVNELRVKALGKEAKFITPEGSCRK